MNSVHSSTVTAPDTPAAPRLVRLVVVRSPEPDAAEWAEIEADRRAERRLVAQAAIAIAVVVVLVVVGRVWL